MIDITQIVIALVGVAMVFITAVLVPWVKSRTNVNQQVIITTLARTAVYAAQQLFGNNVDKRDYALHYMTKQLKQYGITLDTNAISAAIEAALKEIKTEIYGDWDGENVRYINPTAIYTDGQNGAGSVK